MHTHQVTHQHTQQRLHNLTAHHSRVVVVAEGADTDTLPTVADPAIVVPAGIVTPDDDNADAACDSQSTNKDTNTTALTTTAKQNSTTTRCLLTADVTLDELLPTTYDNTTWNDVDDCNTRPRGCTPAAFAAASPQPLVAVTVTPFTVIDIAFGSTPPDVKPVNREFVNTATSPSVISALNAAAVMLLAVLAQTDNDVSNVLPTAHARAHTTTESRAHVATRPERNNNSPKQPCAPTTGM